MILDVELDYGTGFQAVDPPRNLNGMMLKIVFTDQFVNASLQNLELEWVGQNAINLNNRFLSGLSGGLGVGEGVGIRIWACNHQVNILDGYIDLGAKTAQFECDLVKAPCVETGKVDWMSKIAAAFDFAFLRDLPVGSPGRIDPATDFKLTPYCITEIPDYTREMLLGVSEFILLKEIYETTQRITEYIEELTGQTTSAIAQLGTSAPTVAGTLAALITYIIYLGLIIFSLVSLTNQLIENIIQRKKSKACMRVQDLFKRGCERLGLQFSSTIVGAGGVYENLTWMPQKQVIPDLSNPVNVFKRPFDEGVNFPNNDKVYGYYEGRFSEFIAEMCKMFNAAVVIIGNTLYFEEVHYWNNNAIFTIPNTGDVGYTHNLPQPNGTNWSELPSNYEVIYSVDQTELNTLHRYEGTSCSVTVSANTVNNTLRIIRTPGTMVQLASAHGVRKEYLNRIENFLNNIINDLFNFVNVFISLTNAVINVVNWVINLFGGNPVTINPIPLLPTNIFNDRIGWLELSNDSFSIPKVFIGEQSGSEWKIAANSAQLIAASTLMNNFHGKNLATRGNQQLVFTNKKFKLCCEDYLALVQKNIVNTPDNSLGKIISMDWDVHNEEAINVEYHVYKNYETNIHETQVNDGSGS